MESLSLFILGILPSLIWLIYFLEKDNDPEPKKMIFLVFVLGVIGAAVAASIQAPVRNFLQTDSVFSGENISGLIDSFVAIAFLEESVKLLAVLGGVFLFKVGELDEPVDFMIYMITAGLGFAALENLLYFSMAKEMFPETLTELAFLRFGITTLFHAVSAGILGYFLAFSVRKMKKRIIFQGLLVVTFFHALYNELVELMTRTESIIYPTLLLSFLLVLTVVLVKAFKQTKRMRGICKPFVK